MLKLLSFILIFTTVLCAEDKVEIYATTMDSENNTVKAYNGVSVVYKDYYLTSESATYNRTSGELELLGNVRATNGVEYKILGNRAKLNIAKKERSFQPFFMLETQSKVWISADEGSAKDKDIDISSGVVSGCNPNDPLWKMEFTSSDYNTQEKWLNIYNARMYIYDIAVFYTPYFGYSLDHTRRTGLLTPSLGISSDEGFYFEQPLYIAEQNWWDLEFKPQVRTARGYGLYSTFRFIDSEISKGEISIGYFKEKEEYFLDQELANEKHYGFNLLYENSNFINQWFGTDLSGQSSMFVDVKNMNDVDYINLSSGDTTQNSTSTQLLSRVNLFYNTENDYMGSYFKYYKDLTSDTNEETLQILPTLHYHHYVETFLEDHLLYNVDIQSNNISREINKDAIQTDLNIPITLQASLFDEYLNVAYTSYLYGQYSSFGGSEEEPTGEYNNGLFARQYNMIEASTQLVRAFDEVSHSISFGARYTQSGFESTDGYYKENKDFCADTVNKYDARCEFYNITDVDEAIQLDFTQYLYDSSGNQIIYHRLAQTLSDGSSDVGELENELSYQITQSINFYNNMFYNYSEGDFSKLLHKLTYRDTKFNVALSHLFKDTFLEETDTTTPYTSYITSSAGYTYDSHYSYHVKMDYDYEYSLKKSAEIGFLYKKRCWDFGLKYVENNKPILKIVDGVNESSSIYDRYIYFTIVFKPFMKNEGGKSEFDLKLPKTLQGS